ncbi:hypothetical protein T190115A13A_40034 [Tenacibaculum sp. 190524A02b]|uniref:Uncharacterized protein n=1 Tax=Tenacibaculum vairaonense TaxID=3137860 RepID=A0ABM9PP62_9FLAO
MIVIKKIKTSYQQLLATPVNNMLITNVLIILFLSLITIIFV